MIGRSKYLKGLRHRIAYLQSLLGSEYLSQELASANSQSVSKQSYLLQVFQSPQVFDVRLQVLGCGQLQALAFEREDLLGIGHGYMRSARSWDSRKRERFVQS